MRIRIEYDENISEEEIIIKAKKCDSHILKLQKEISDMLSLEQKLILHKGEASFFIPLEEILFFETEDSVVYAHTKKEMYQSDQKLYELEESLPGHFMRVSKSTILNISKVYSLTVSLPSTRIVEFTDSHKQVYVSRYYYKPVKIKLEEMRRIL